MTEKVVMMVIDMDRYDELVQKEAELKDCKAWLICLEECGIDQWEGIEEARDKFFGKEWGDEIYD